MMRLSCRLFLSGTTWLSGLHDWQTDGNFHGKFLFFFVSSARNNLKIVKQSTASKKPLL